MSVVRSVGKFSEDEIERIFSLYNGGFKAAHADRILKHTEGTCGRYYKCVNAAINGDKVDGKRVSIDAFTAFCKKHGIEFEYADYEDQIEPLYSHDKANGTENTGSEALMSVTEILSSILEFLHEINENIDTIGGCILENTDVLKSIAKELGVEYKED